MTCMVIRHGSELIRVSFSGIVELGSTGKQDTHWRIAGGVLGDNKVSKSQVR